MDVSALYISLHPFHERGRAQQVLAPYLKRALGNYASESSGCITRDLFTFDSAFACDIREMIRDQFPIRSQSFASPLWFVLNLSLILAWSGASMMLILEPCLSIAIASGILSALIGLHSHHASSHGSISQHAWVNDLFALTSDLFGHSKYMWFQQHVLAHHVYTSIPKLDPDIHTEPFFVRCREEQRLKSYHRFQTLYCWIFFSMLAASSLLNLDAFLKHRFARSFRVVDYSFKRRHYTRLMKSIHVLFEYALPLWLHGPGFFIFSAVKMATGSLLLSALFIVNHLFEKDVDNNNSSNESGKAKEKKNLCWYEHQVVNSCSYGGWISCLMTGGLNYQIEHHLFPRINSMHYHRLAPLVQQICAKHGVQYQRFDSFTENLGSSLKRLLGLGYEQK
jgi:fatty acid desaturase